MTHDDDDAGAESDREAEPSEAPPPRRSRSKRNQKKERVLHTRVPEVLDQELKKLAGNLRVPVSNVVRAILEDALDAVDTVSERTESELLGFVERLARQRDARRRESEPPRHQAKPAKTTPARDEPAASAPAADESVDDERGASACPAEPGELLDGVFGYQPLVLATDSECSVCGRALSAGQEAHRALFDDPGRRVFLGPDCRLLPAKES